MTAGPFTSEAIALTEKKMNMSLDEIIRLSKNGSLKIKQKWVPVQNKGQSGLSGSSAEINATKVRRFLDARSTIRQGYFAQRRSSFKGDQFSVTNEAARKAAAAVPFRNRGFNNRTVNRYPYRFGARPVQRKAFTWGLSVNLEQSKAAFKQKPHTLDALFANLREQRMKSFSTLNNGQWKKGAQHKYPPWLNRFGH